MAAEAYTWNVGPVKGQVGGNGNRKQEEGGEEEEERGDVCAHSNLRCCDTHWQEKRRLRIC